MSETGRVRWPGGWTLAALVFVALALMIPLVARDNPAVGALCITFVSIVLEAFPFVMLGALIGGLVEVFVSRERLTAWLPKNRNVAILIAGLLGVVFPVCECAIVPVTRRLVRKGVPFSVAVAYLLAGPIVNPLVAASTYVAYNGDWIVVATRLICGLGIAVFVALLVDELFPGQRALLPDAAERPVHDLAAPGCACGHAHEHGECADVGRHAHEHAVGQAHGGEGLWGRLVHALEHAADEFLHVSQFLVVGAFAAALSQTLVAREAFLALAATPAAGIGLMMVLAVLLNLCSEADAFVAASFRGYMPESAQLAFMVLGPMVDLKLVAMYASFVRRKAVVTIVGAVCALVFGMMLALAWFGGGGGV